VYYPYFRGKQFELITIREEAGVMAQARFVPIIEPVRQSLNGLQRALDAVCAVGGEAVVIVNPFHGDHSEGSTGITSLLEKGYLKGPFIRPGLLLNEGLSLEEALACYENHKQHKLVLVHAGFPDGKALSEKLGKNAKSIPSVFVDSAGIRIYRRHFPSDLQVFIKDGFERRRNADHPPVERFSDLHLTFKDDGFKGFGDFLVVGDEYSESGGPAYAVAIHLTFMDPDQDDVMFIYHFVSTDRHTPTDPAGKFGQALKKLIDELDTGKSKLLETTAIKEFRKLHERQHFPGLGYVKKLSMNHHIETLAEYCAKL
jgi:hypothetical protein